MRIRALNRQNDWSDFGKGFIVKMRKSTGFLLAFQHFIIRKYAQEFPIFHIYNLLKNSKIQNQESPKMNINRRRLGNARSIR